MVFVFLVAFLCTYSKFLVAFLCTYSKFRNVHFNLGHYYHLLYLFQFNIHYPLSHSPIGGTESIRLHQTVLG
jgi:hypothetical protein